MTTFDQRRRWLPARRRDIDEALADVETGSVDVDALVADSRLTAAFARAIEDEDHDATGAWDFTQAPTLNGGPIGVTSYSDLTDKPTIQAANVLDLGVKGDVITITDAAITSGQATLSRAGATKFTAADVGKKVHVVGAGAAYTDRGPWAASTSYAAGDRFTFGGITWRAVTAVTSGTVFTSDSLDKAPANSATLMATITAVNSGVATLDTNAGTTVSGATAVVGTDDSAAVAALPAGDYYFPGGRSYFVANWVVPSRTHLRFGAGAIFKWPSFPTTNPWILGLFDNANPYATDIHLHGLFTADGSELTPAAGTNPRGVFILNCQDWSIDQVRGVGLPGHTGIVVQTGYNSTTSTGVGRGAVGAIRSENTRGVGSACVQHTSGTDVAYGLLTADGGVPARFEMDADDGVVTDNVTVELAHVTNDSGVGHAAVYFSAHTNALRGVTVAKALAEGGAEGVRWEYEAGGSIASCTIKKMRVTGGGRASVIAQNDISLPDCRIEDAEVISPVNQPGYNNTNGSDPGVGFAVAPGMTLDNPRCSGAPGDGIKDAWQTGGVVAGSRVTIINPKVTGGASRGIVARFIEQMDIIVGEATGNTSYGLLGLTGTTINYFGTKLTENTAGATSTAGTINGGAKTVTAWTALSLTGAGQTSGYRVPAVRLNGDQVEFRGSMTFSASYTAGTTLCTLASQFRPDATAEVSVRTTSGANALNVTSAGVVSLAAGASSGQRCTLDGVSYSLA